MAAVLVAASVGVGTVIHSYQHRDDPTPPTPPKAVEVPGTSTRLVLPARTVHAGSTIHGTVVVTNSTGHPIEGVDCRSPFGVELESHRAVSNPPQALCATDFVIPVGRSTYPVDIITTFATCTHEGSSNDPAFPRCEHGRPPNLPNGTYRAYVTSADPVVSSAPPVEIRIQ